MGRDGEDPFSGRRQRSEEYSHAGVPGWRLFCIGALPKPLCHSFFPALLGSFFLTALTVADLAQGLMFIWPWSPEAYVQSAIYWDGGTPPVRLPPSNG